MFHCIHLLTKLLQSAIDIGYLWSGLGVEEGTVRLEAPDGLGLPEAGDGTSLTLGRDGGGRDGEGEMGKGERWEGERGEGEMGKGERGEG